jgi:hypothetical protein
VGQDVSSSNEISGGDEEAEVVESNSIVDNDGLSSDQSEYAKNICIPILPNLRLCLGRI